MPVEGGKLQDILGEPVSILVNIDQYERLLEVYTIWWSNERGTGVLQRCLAPVPLRHADGDRFGQQGGAGQGFDD